MIVSIRAVPVECRDEVQHSGASAPEFAAECVDPLYEVGSTVGPWPDVPGIMELRGYRFSKGERSSRASAGIPADCGQKNSFSVSSLQKSGNIRGVYWNMWRPSVRLAKTAMKVFIRIRSSHAKRHER